MDIASDIPKYILEMLSAVDYSRITEADYAKWTALVSNNIGKYLRLRTAAVKLMKLPYPVNQSFLDLLNRYDFRSLPKLKEIVFIPIAKAWANANLPLIKRID